MRLVEPIRDHEVIAKIEEFLMNTNERNYILFLTGIYTGLRISDLVKLQVRDIRGWKITVREKKTNKTRIVHMPTHLKNETRKYIEHKKDNDFLFPSRKKKHKHLTRGGAYKMLKCVEKRFELESIGTHSLRKTYGYHHFQINNDIATLQQELNHTSQVDTLRYIGVTQKTKDKCQLKMKLGKANPKTKGL